jgi:GMP synthase (glutamine-hydrolysing)
MILIIDNGSQYTHLIKRNCRDLGYEAEVLNAKTTRLYLNSALKDAEKIILSGGPNSVYHETSKTNLSSLLVEMIRNSNSGSTLANTPILGICFGHQMIAQVFGAKVEKGKSAEYGTSEIIVDEPDIILSGMPKRFTAWVSHFDEVKELPKGFIALAHSDTCPIEAMRHESRPIFSVQFHPEVWHTQDGERILKNFLELKR